MRKMKETKRIYLTPIEVLMERAREAVSDPGVFSEDQAKALSDMVNLIESAIEEGKRCGS